MKKGACRVCNEADNFKKILHLPRAPRNVERLLENHSFSYDTPIELNVYQCLVCGHVQLIDELEPQYYEEYLMSHSHARKMQEYQKRQATTFLNHFNLVNPRVFEAGCGDGQFSLMLRNMGCDVLANEPSTKARQACEQKGLNVIGGYVGQNAFPEMNGHFNMVIARQVLEHVPDPNDFMKGVREVLMPEGLGLIEVPSLEQAVEHNRFFDFFPDHLSYFSSNALTYLFIRNGFEVVKIFRAMDGEYNEAWIKRREHTDFTSLQNAANDVSESFRVFLEKESAAGKRVAVWGAGAKGVVTLASVDVSPIAYLIDKDPVKHRRFTPVSHLQVWPPEILLENPVDTVVITALAYKDEIIKDLKKKYSFKGKIACLVGGKISEV